MKHFPRLLTLMLLLALCITAVAGCTQSDPNTPEETTEAPESKLTIDSTYHIGIPDDADDVIRKTADMLVATLKEKTGLELTVKEADDQSHMTCEVALGVVNDYEAGAYTVKMQGSALMILASDSTSLYYAVEAVLDTWLTADFGLAEAGVITLPESRVAELNGLPTKKDNAIKLMTQNLRDGDDPNGNGMVQRYERFLLLLEDYQPDIIGTQEHSYNWYVRFKKLFENMDGGEAFPKYGMVGDTVDGPNKVGGGRNAILYRVDRFDLVDTGTFWLTDTPDVPSGIGHRRVCTWALLKDKQTEKTILVANTHLDHQNDQTRVKQIKVLMDYMADKVGDYPFFLTGDFNSTSYGTTYEIVTSTLSDSHKTAWVDRSTKTHTYHGYFDQSGGIEIDFIFHDQHGTPLSYEIISTQYGGYVSDHYGVITEFVYD